MSGNTHDYTEPKRHFGHDLTYSLVNPDGTEVRAIGWGSGISEGDYILLSHADGDVTRYRFDTVNYKRDPADMWTARLIFSPRENGGAT